MTKKEVKAQRQVSFKSFWKQKNKFYFFLKSCHLANFIGELVRAFWKVLFSRIAVDLLLLRLGIAEAGFVLDFLYFYQSFQKVKIILKNLKYNLRFFKF